MIVVAFGGASSGKSAWAESHALALPGPHYYAATMRHGGAETEARITRHLAQREGKGFITLELADGDALPADRSGTVLLEDVGNAVVNGLQTALEELLSWDNLVVVTNDVGADGVSYDAYTEEFIEEIGRLSRLVAQRADEVVEVVAGVPRSVREEA